VSSRARTWSRAGGDGAFGACEVRSALRIENYCNYYIVGGLSSCQINGFESQILDFSLMRWQPCKLAVKRDS
jgi:hypothetical protein